MSYLIDTNVVSELRKGKKCDSRVATWQARHTEENQLISVISMMELRLGISLAMRRNKEHAGALEAWYENRLKPAFSGRIVPVDLAVSENCAQLHAARTRPFRDALIGATALVHGLIMVTRNVNDFSKMGLKIVNPWEEE